MSLKSMIMDCIVDNAPVTSWDIVGHFDGNLSIDQVGRVVHNLLFSRAIKVHGTIIPNGGGRKRQRFLYEVNNEAPQIKRAGVGAPFDMALIDNKHNKINLLNQLIERSGDKSKDILISIRGDYANV